jgi:hypothetical protein
MNVPVATSNPEIRWSEPSIINSRQSLRAPFGNHYAAASQARPPGKSQASGDAHGHISGKHMQAVISARNRQH